jgi:plasmid maintenance system killer protein
MDSGHPLQVSQVAEGVLEPARHGPQVGHRQAQVLRRRLDDLRAAPTLATMRALPGRCHELTGNRAGQISLDLVHPMRLIFEPADDPPSIKPDGGLDWKGNRAVRILSVEDTHG